MNNGGGGKDDLVHHNLQIMQLKGKRKTRKGIYESKKQMTTMELGIHDVLTVISDENDAAAF